jgi:hypothetical protein
VRTQGSTWGQTAQRSIHDLLHLSRCQLMHSRSPRGQVTSGLDERQRFTWRRRRFRKSRIAIGLDMDPEVLRVKTAGDQLVRLPPVDLTPPRCMAACNVGDVFETSSGSGGGARGATDNRNACEGSPF